jgi:hypothetical protein
MSYKNINIIDINKLELSYNIDILMEEDKKNELVVNKDELIINKNYRLKNLRFKEERKKILTDLLNIVGITETNKIFYSHIIDENEETQKQILAFENEIETYFKVSSWPAYKEQSRHTLERRYLSILKSVIKEMNVKFTSASLKTKYKNKVINTTMYTIESIE